MNYIFFLEKKQLLKKCRFRCYWIPRWRINKQLCLASSHWNWCWNISNLWYYKPSKLLGKLLKFIKCTVNLDSVKLWICTLMYGKCRLFKKTTFVSPDWIPPGTIAGNHRLFLLVHAPFHCESCWQPPLCPPTFARWSYCLSRCRLQMILKPQICVEYGKRTREHQSGHQSSYWLWTSVLNFSDLARTWCHTPSTHQKTLHPTPLQLLYYLGNWCSDLL